MHPENLGNGDVKKIEVEVATHQKSITERSLSALKWNYLGAFTRVGLQFLIGIVLARLLGPEPFGLVAVATLVMGLGALFADFGLASALIQSKKIDTMDIRYVFTMQAFFGLCITIILELCASFIADFFHRPDALPILQVMFLLFFIQSLGQTSNALLQRELDFRRVQICQILSYILGFVVFGLPLAYYGFGAWSLVIAQLLQTTFCTLFTYSLKRHSLIPCVQNGTNKLMSFGLMVLLTNLSNWGLACLDSVVLGRTFGTTQLGIYNRAFSLVAMPTYNLISSLQGILFSASSRAQNDIENLSQTYLGAVGIIGFISLPIFFIVASISETMIMSVYGSKWLDAVTILTPLALAMPLSALMGLGGPLMRGMGRVGLEMKIQFLCLIIFIILLWFASAYTLQVVAWSVFTSYLIRFFLITNFILSELKLKWITLLEVLVGPVTLAITCATIALFTDNLMQYLSATAILRLIIVIIISTIMICLFLYYCKSWIFARQTLPLIRKVTSSLPPWLNRWIKI